MLNRNILHGSIPLRVSRLLVTMVAIAAVCSIACAQTPAAPEEAQDKGWPRQFETADHLVRVHQPQVDDWPNFDRINFRAALVVSDKADEGEPAYGTIVVSADTTVAFDEKLVVLSNRKIEQLEFPDVDAAESERLKKIVMDAMPPEKPQTVSLDRIVAQVDPAKAGARKVDVNLAPPKIYASQQPAVMVIFMGQPRLKPIASNDLMVAVNTNWDVLFDPSSSNYYLLKDQSWFQTADLAKGPWTPATTLPAGLSKLPDDENWADVRKAVPGEPATEIPVIFVSYEPAELIVTYGQPEMQPIPGTKLMLVTNTENQLFYNTAEKHFYLLAAGRWFRAETLAGPWASASTDLPEDFTKIPEDSDAADVLASVPETPAANEAVVMSSIPNKATVNRTDVTVNVTYSDDAPDFRPVEGTTISYAYNSPFNVFLVDGKYYCCYNAVWFVAPTPTGAWTVCDTVPAAIYTIPPTSPMYNVTYVHVYDSTPTTVTTGYTGGYSGQTVAATGAVMFGIGMLVGAALEDDDDDDYYWAYHYPPCYYSYGCGATWHGGYGGYVSAGRIYGPYGGAGGFASYNPATGFYSRGGYAYGPGGAAGYRAAYNPATGQGGYRAGGVTPYGSWSRGAVTNGDDWVRGGQASGARGSIGAIQGSEGGSLAHAQGRYGNGVTVGQTRDGDLYAGRDGNVYKKTDDGWEQQWSRSNAARSVDSAQPRRSNENYAQQRSRPSSEQSQYLQQRSSSRQRGESNVNRSRQPRSSGGGYGGGRSGGGRSGGGRRR